jgi:hypothetical protein
MPTLSSGQSARFRCRINDSAIGLRNCARGEPRLIDMACQECGIRLLGANKIIGNDPPVVSDSEEGICHLGSRSENSYRTCVRPRTLLAQPYAGIQRPHGWHRRGFASRTFYSGPRFAPREFDHGHFDSRHFVNEHHFNHRRAFIHNRFFIAGGPWWWGGSSCWWWDPRWGAGFGFATESKRLALWEPAVGRSLVICDVADT